ncbi:hypothetical protein EPN44_14855 [bacterium]|nr:MAG: hypothetical protein EPN44_14855 [bacterium]
MADGLEKPDEKRGLRLFGSPLRTGILVLTAALGDTYPSELARLLNARTSVVQRAIKDLEYDGLLATQPRTGIRRVTIDPRRYGARELIAYLERLAAAPPYTAILDNLRVRPRRQGKPL